MKLNLSKDLSLELKVMSEIQSKVVSKGWHECDKLLELQRQQHFKDYNEEYNYKKEKMEGDEGNNVSVSDIISDHNNAGEADVGNINNIIYIHGNEANAIDAQKVNGNKKENVLNVEHNVEET